MAKDKKLYDKLGVDENATEDEIKKAYRDKAKQNHSDKGGDDKEMADLNNAYAILRNPEKRKKYDETGETGEKKEPSFEDQFNAFVQQVFLDGVIETEKTVEYVDMIAIFNKYVEMVIKQNVDRVKDLNKKAAKLQKVFDRIEDKAGINLIGMVVTENIKQLKLELAAAEKGLKFLEDVKEYLKTYTYKVDPKTDERDFLRSSLGSFTFKA